MKLHHLRISNFQSFGPATTEILFDDLTFVIGPNGAGKTAILQALSRLFGFDPNSRRIHRSDFHIPFAETPETAPAERSLYVEAEFTFPELSEEKGDFATIPPHFAHMRLDTTDGVPRVRFRLDATIDAAGDIVDELSYVLDIDANGQPVNKHTVPRADRNNIHVHYLPARRDPSDHISYTAHSLLGRALRSADWQADRQEIAASTKEISDRLRSNNAVKSVSDSLTARWQTLHRGAFFSDPQVTFVESEIESLLRHVSIAFTPGHGEPLINFARLSDGQKSLLYLALVLAMQRTGRAILDGTETSFDVDKFKPAIFTLFAVEEPENSLSPHYLGRVVDALKDFAEANDAQAVIATHAPSMLRRVAPEDIRYLRLDSVAPNLSAGSGHARGDR
jgi:putative ATP-dependent endonuclease of OLD family